MVNYTRSNSGEIFKKQVSTDVQEVQDQLFSPTLSYGSKPGEEANPFQTLIDQEL